MFYNTPSPNYETETYPLFYTELLYQPVSVILACCESLTTLLGKARSSPEINTPVSEGKKTHNIEHNSFFLLRLAIQSINKEFLGCFILFFYIKTVESVI